MVGAIVVPASAGSRCSSSGCSAPRGGEGDGEVVAGVVRVAEQHPEHRVDERVRHGRRQSAADPGQHLAEVRDRVVADRRGAAVPGLADGGDASGVGALLADADADQAPAVGQLEQLAAALVDAQVRPDVGAGLEQPAHADVGHAVLLVGDGEEPQVAPRPPARPDELLDRDRTGRDLALHVQRAAPVEVAVVVEDALERRMGPVAGVDGHDVGVTHEREARRTRLGPRHAGHQVRPVRSSRATSSHSMPASPR